MMTLVGIAVVIALVGGVLVIAHAANDMAETKNEKGACNKADYDLADKLAAKKN